MIEPRVVLAPLDGSCAAASALPIARALAQAWDVSLHVVHIAPGGDARAALDLAPELGLDPADVGNVVLDERVGDAGEAIVRAADEWRDPVIVLCSRTGAHAELPTLGPVSARVLARCRYPVVIVPPHRGRQPWALRVMLVPHVGTPTASCATALAMDLARRVAATVRVLHVACPRDAPPREPGALATPRYVDQQHHEWPAWAKEFVDRLALATFPPPSLRLALVHGEPASAIRTFAAEHQVDLIVLCSHRDLDPGRATVLLGVLRDAPAPVLVLPYD